MTAKWFRDLYDTNTCAATPTTSAIRFLYRSLCFAVHLSSDALWSRRRLHSAHWICGTKHEHCQIIVGCSLLHTCENFAYRFSITSTSTLDIIFSTTTIFRFWTRIFTVIHSLSLLLSLHVCGQVKRIWPLPNVKVFVEFNFFSFFVFWYCKLLRRTHNARSTYDYKSFSGHFKEARRKNRSTRERKKNEVGRILDAGNNDNCQFERVNGKRNVCKNEVIRRTRFNYNVTKAFRSGSLIDDAFSLVVSDARMAAKIAQHVINNVR